MKKSDRDKIFNKYGGKCAYCGCELQKGWHCDHIEPYFHNWSDELRARYNIIRDNTIDNHNPSCARCNKWKSTHSVEGFRNEISEQIQRLKNYSSNFRMALDYKLIEETNKSVKFYFEYHNQFLK